MSEPIKAGNVVRLKSSGPKITVVHVDEHLPICSCAWFAGAEVQRGEFYAVALKLDDGRSSIGFIE